VDAVSLGAAAHSAEHYEGPWFYSPVPAATPLVTWTDGSSEMLSRRERPQVLTNAEGDVEVLYNGVCCREGPGHTEPQDSYTLAVPTTAHHALKADDVAASRLKADEVASRAGKCAFTAGLEYGGGDLLPTPLPAQSPDECCKLCSDHNACSFWTFDTALKKEPPTQPTKTHHCYLKNDQVTVSKSSRFVSGPPAPPPGPSAGSWRNPCAGNQSASPWCDETKSNMQRAQALVAAMTVAEKAVMMSARENPGIARLDIGPIHFQEALHGVITVCLSEQLCPTAFPAWIGMAASFDQQLWEEVATVIGTEGRAYANIKASHTAHALAFWAPDINMVRDPRW